MRRRALSQETRVGTISEWCQWTRLRVCGMGSLQIFNQARSFLERWAITCVSVLTRNNLALDTGSGRLIPVERLHLVISACGGIFWYGVLRRARVRSALQRNREMDKHPRSRPRKLVNQTKLVRIWRTHVHLEEDKQQATEP